ncbi:PP2C family serine/threonine-protein phosphatase [Gynuella sunshinyii]|uniref:Serine/threonine protein phosphatase n=1 Tax=Gynuella sunshinyii YC6258 TaxID=1445510 RepID=A0A0C5VQG6_9GAMM|nr:PP2C family serine/threonine-protein phosphatase [Gynuella sunshinyii]AJQ92519.1 serine/threonine protein phosphatase [Gynuella sunshinyii YC6258]
MGWQYAAASVTGASHVQQQLPCQDAWQIQQTDSGIIACVADGAGSAARSEIGSRTLVDHLCQTLAPQLDQLISHTDGAQMLVDAIDEVRQELSELGPIAEFHATLCGLIATAHGQMVFHIGDGVVLGINPGDWQDYVISEPENGEYADMTYFFTLPGWQQHLRIWCPHKPYPLWFLMSDGVSGFATTGTQTAGPQESFLKPVHQYLSTVSSDQGSEALNGTLQDKRAAAISHDDKTLAWLYMNRN